MLKVTTLNLFPVKSLRGCRRASVEVKPWGIVGDRHFMVVDDNGRFLTQREIPQMATVDTKLDDCELVLSGPDRDPLHVAWPAPTAERVTVTVWRDRVEASLVAHEADAWLTSMLNKPCRLVFMADPATARAVDPSFAKSGDHVSFADGFPLLLTSTASLSDLNARLHRPVDMNRFRANVVVDGPAPWAEDDWARVRIGSVVFDVVKPCARCIVTTTDQVTGARDPAVEPIRTLQRFRRDAQGQVLFGQNLIPRSVGPIEEGDRVEILA